MAGRPTKFKKKYIKEANQYIDDSTIPYIEELALLFDVDDTTLLAWADRNEQFLATIKKLRTKQRFKLQKMGMSRKINTAMSIFLLKANHGLKETTINENYNTEIVLEIGGDDDEDPTED